LFIAHKEKSVKFMIHDAYIYIMNKL
jgi:hypothetical protein